MGQLCSPSMAKYQLPVPIDVTFKTKFKNWVFSDLSHAGLLAEINQEKTKHRRKHRTTFKGTQEGEMAHSQAQKR